MKNNTTMRFGVGLVALSVFALSGCAPHHKVKDDSSETQLIVDQKMSETVTSANNALQALVRIERGDEAPRNQNNAIGTTVAGRPSGLVKSPFSVPSVPGGGTQTSRALIAQQLDTPVNIRWNGEASDLLRSLATKAGFSYQTVGSSAGKNSNIKITARQETIKTVLGRVAESVEGTADVKVDLATKTIKLIYR